MSLLGDVIQYGSAAAGVMGAPLQALGISKGQDIGDAVTGYLTPKSNPYNYTPLSGKINSQWADANDQFRKRAYDTSGYKDALNKDVASQSSLMGPSNGDPESDALAARSKQMYDSNVNQIARRAQPMAQQATTGLQTQDLSHQAAIFSNEQSQAAINFQEAKFKREAAIQMANLQNQLYATLFGGVAQTAGSAMALATKTPADAPTAPSGPQTTSSSGNWWAQPGASDLETRYS